MLVYTNSNILTNNGYFIIDDLIKAWGKPEETYNLVKENGNWKVDYIKGGVNNATEAIGDGMEKLEDAVEEVKEAVDSVTVE